MFTARQTLDLQQPPANGGPAVISEDFVRMLKLYNVNEYIHQFESIKNEVYFLKSAFGEEYISYLHKGILVPSENLDIVWSFLDIKDKWTRRKYFEQKRSHLKYLKDLLQLVNLYDYYKDLEPFVLLDGLEGIQAERRDALDMTPLAYLNDQPVTRFHETLVQDSMQAYNELPQKFSCLGYNFTKKPGKVIMRANCGLALYKGAEFSNTAEGFLITPENIRLFNFKQLVQNKQQVLREEGSLPQLKEDVRKEEPTFFEKFLGDHMLAIDSLFYETQGKKINPLLGNRPEISKLISEVQKVIYN